MAHKECVTFSFVGGALCVPEGVDGDAILTMVDDDLAFVSNGRRELKIPTSELVELRDWLDQILSE